MAPLCEPPLRPPAPSPASTRASALLPLAASQRMGTAPSDRQARQLPHPGTAPSGRLPGGATRRAVPAPAGTQASHHSYECVAAPGRPTALGHGPQESGQARRPPHPALPQRQAARAVPLSERSCRKGGFSHLRESVMCRTHFPSLIVPLISVQCQHFPLEKEQSNTEIFPTAPTLVTTQFPPLR